MYSLKIFKALILLYESPPLQCINFSDSSVFLYSLSSLASKISKYDNISKSIILSFFDDGKISFKVFSNLFAESFSLLYESICFRILLKIFISSGVGENSKSLIFFLILLNQNKYMINVQALLLPIYIFQNYIHFYFLN